MKGFTLPAVLLLALPFVAGCADQADRPAIPMAPLLAGKPTSGSGETDSRSIFLLQTSSSSIYGDGAAAFTANGTSRYREGECGVKAVVYASGDGYLQTNNPKLKDRKCSDYPRRVGATFDGGSADGGVVMNANNIRGITEGTSALRKLNVTIDGSPCGRLLFSGEPGVDAKYVNVTRVDAKTWRVESVPVDEWGNTTARCETDLTIRKLGPFSFRIVAD